MQDYALLIELFLVVGVVLGWAVWDLRKTSKQLEKTRTENSKQTGAASEKEASPSQ